jgi:hypothetical protein
MAHMPFPEGEQRPHELEGRQEQEQIPYFKAARFKSERPAKKAYFRAQDILFKTPDCDISAYRFLIKQIWHVALPGDPPPEDLEKKLQSILARGEATSLPPDVLKLLTERRNQATKQAPWVERHYRPGRYYQV